MAQNPKNPKDSKRLKTFFKLLYIVPPLMAFGIFGYLAWNRLSGKPPPAHVLSGKPFLTTRIDGLSANFFTQGDQLRAAGNDLFIEFRDVGGGFADVGDVHFELGLKTPNVVMHSIGKVFRTGTPGQYRTTIQTQLGGDWTATLGYAGARGSVETNFNISVK